MGILFRNPKQPHPPTSQWARFAVIGAIVVAIVANMAGFRPSGSQPADPTAIPSAASWNMFSIDTYKTRLIPGYGELNSTDTKEGSGARAICGQTVDIRYSETVLPDVPVNKTETTAEMKERSFRLGDAEVPEALTAAVIGMKRGGTRTVIVPAERNAPAHTPLRYTITLTGASPNLDEPEAGSLPLRAFDIHVGPAQLIRCGDTVNAHLTAWSMDGRKLLDSRTKVGKPVRLTLGEPSMMAGLAQGIPGMTADGGRSLIIPPHLQQPLAESKDSTIKTPEILHNLKLPDNQAILVDIELIP